MRTIREARSRLRRSCLAIGVLGAAACSRERSPLPTESPAESPQPNAYVWKLTSSAEPAAGPRTSGPPYLFLMNTAGPW
jgi:hypothetical protein